MFDEYRQKLQGLLGAMPLVQILRGEAPVNREGLLGALKGIKPFQAPSEEEAMQYSNAITPIGLLGTFAGVGAKTANKGLLTKAESLEKSGADRAAIWNDTGWFRGPDKKWRFEIDDSGSGIRLGQEKSGGYGVDKLPETYSHKQVFKAYPDTKKINTTWSDSDQNGYFYVSQSDNGIEMGQYIDLPRNATKEVKRSVALHEIQHAIQNREGFARGGNQSEFGFSGLVENADEIAALDRMRLDAMKKYPKVYEIDAKINKGIYPTNDEWDYFEKITAQEPFKSISEKRAYLIKTPLEQYKSLAGEAEARAVQARMDFDAAKRKSIPPWESYDIPWDQLIVR